MKKGETEFEARIMSQKAIEGVTEDCLRTEASCGNPDIVDLRLEKVVAHYTYSTERDKYHGAGAASVVRNTDTEPKNPTQSDDEPVPEPKIIDRDDAGRDFANEPNDVFGEIDNNDGASYISGDEGSYHESDATGSPYGDDFPQEDRMEMVRAAKRYSKNLGDDGQFNGT